MLPMRGGYGATPSTIAQEPNTKAWLEACRLWSSGEDDGERGWASSYHGSLSLHFQQSENLKMTLTYSTSPYFYTKRVSQI